MTPVEQHTAVLAALAELERLATAAGGPGATWEGIGESEDLSRDIVPGFNDDEPPQVGGYGVVYRADKSILAHPEGALLVDEARHIGAHNPAAVLEVLAGRRRILERHAPEHANNGALICSRCLDDHGYPDPSDWPCPDYRDAAAGLGVELGA